MLPHSLITSNDGFSRAPEIDFRYEIKARKVMVDFKFDALAIQVCLHREPREVGGVKKVNRKFVLVGGVVCANPT